MNRLREEFRVHVGSLASRVLALALVSILPLGGFPARDPASLTASSLAISGLSARTSSVPLYDKLELTFNVDNTVATNLQFPYDPAPPPGLPGRVGISVEGLFLPPGQDDWSQALHQPGFLYQGYERKQIGGKEWLYPQGEPVWKLRFAPSLVGTWHYKVRAQDASICPAGVSPCVSWVESNVGSFDVQPPRPGQHGFIQVSQDDPRYFEFSDGTPFVGLGFNAGFSLTRFTADASSQLARDAANGITFLRIWMTGSDIAGSAWGPWTWFGGHGYGGYLADPGLVVAPVGSGHDFVFSLDQQSGRTCIVNGYSQGPIAVKPSSTYRLTVDVTASGIAGPRDGGTPNYGFAVKLAGWPANDSCPDGIESAPNLISYVHGTIGWTTLQGTVTTGPTEYFLPYLYLLLDNVSAGHAYVSRVSLREVLPGGGLGPEILVKSSSDAHLDFNQLRSWDWDVAIDQAEQDGVYLKLVVLEKNDLVWNDINADGSLTSAGSNSNFYAAPDTKVRRLHEYFWRYLTARWGYATSVHSWELMNEGDPFNGKHYEMANSFARAIHRLDPNRHLATTSTWHSFPVGDFWGNPSYPDVDYADLHAYVSSGLGIFEWNPPSGTTLDTNPTDTYQGSRGAIEAPAGTTSATKGLWIRGQGSWTISVRIKAQNIAGSCPYGAPASLAGPQLQVTIQGITTRDIPYDPGKPDTYWICTSPAGTYDYTQFSGVIPVPDNQWHVLTLSFQNRYATSGTAWFENLVIQSPDGRVARLYGDGTFDDEIRTDYDTAWFTTVYSLLDGAKGVSGAGKPVVRGEAGIDSPTQQVELPRLANDRHGVWLHNLEWGTLNSGGMYELYWWTQNIEKNNLYFQYKPVHDFLTGIPLNNGRYQDAQARASAANVRVIGQKDLADGLAHLWIQNVDHTWYNVVNGVPWGALSGTVTVSGFVPGQTYDVAWWEFDDPGNLSIQQSAVTADASGALVLNLSTLPSTVTDVGVKISNSHQPYTQQITPALK